MDFLLLTSKSYVDYGSLCMGFGLFQFGFGLLVKIEVLVLLGGVKSMVYISVLYSNKLEWINNIIVF